MKSLPYLRIHIESIGVFKFFPDFKLKNASEARDKTWINQNQLTNAPLSRNSMKLPADCVVCVVSCNALISGISMHTDMKACSIYNP